MEAVRRQTHTCPHASYFCHLPACPSPAHALLRTSLQPGPLALEPLMLGLSQLHVAGVWGGAPEAGSLHSLCEGLSADGGPLSSPALLTRWSEGRRPIPGLHFVPPPGSCVSLSFVICNMGSCCHPSSHRGCEERVSSHGVTATPLTGVSCWALAAVSTSGGRKEQTRRLTWGKVERINAAAAPSSGRSPAALLPTLSWPQVLLSKMGWGCLSGVLNCVRITS